jgi:hypothetical protein
VPFKKFAAWAYEVDRQFRIRTRKSWKELYGDDKALREAFKREEPPPEFVVRWIEENGLKDFTKDARY